MSYNQACKLFSELDELFNSNSVDEYNFNELSVLYNDYCPQDKNGDKKCITDYDRISAVAGYLFTSFITENGIDINSDNDYNVQYFIMWISSKLYEIATKNSESLNQPYENNLDKSIGNFDFLNSRDNTKELKDANITIMNIFYLLFKEICEAVWMDQGKKTVLYEHTSKITQCFIIYTELSKFVYPCSPYIELLEHLKKTYDDYREIAIKKKIHGQHTSGLLRKFPEIDKTTQKFNFKSPECKKVHKQLIKNAQKLIKEEKDKEEGKGKKEKKEKRNDYEEEEDEEDHDDDPLSNLLKLLTSGDDDNDEPGNVKSQDKKLEKRNESKDSRSKPQSPEKSNKSTTVTQTQPSKNTPHSTNVQPGKNPTPVTPGKSPPVKPAATKPAPKKPAPAKPAPAKPATKKPATKKPEATKQATSPKAQPKPETQQSQQPSTTLRSTEYETSKIPKANTSNETSETGSTGTKASTSTKTSTEHPPSPSAKPSTEQQKATSLKLARSAESPQPEKETNPSSQKSVTLQKEQQTQGKKHPPQPQTAKLSPTQSQQQSPKTLSSTESKTNATYGTSIIPPPAKPADSKSAPASPQPKQPPKTLPSATPGTATTPSSVTTSAPITSSITKPMQLSAQPVQGRQMQIQQRTPPPSPSLYTSQKSEASHQSGIKNSENGPDASKNGKKGLWNGKGNGDDGVNGSGSSDGKSKDGAPKKIDRVNISTPGPKSSTTATTLGNQGNVSGITQTPAEPTKNLSPTSSGTITTTTSTTTTVSTGATTSTTMSSTKSTSPRKTDTSKQTFQVPRLAVSEGSINNPTTESGTTGDQSSSQHITSENSGNSSKKDTQVKQVNSSSLNHQPHGTTGKAQNQAMKSNDQGNNPQNERTVSNNGSDKSPGPQNGVGNTKGNAETRNKTVSSRDISNQHQSLNSKQGGVDGGQGTQNGVSAGQGIRSGTPGVGSNSSMGGVNASNQSQQDLPATSSLATTSYQLPSRSVIPSNIQGASPKPVLQLQSSIDLSSTTPGAGTTSSPSKTVSAGTASSMSTTAPTLTESVYRQSSAEKPAESPPQVHLSKKTIIDLPSTTFGTNTTLLANKKESASIKTSTTTASTTTTTSITAPVSIGEKAKSDMSSIESTLSGQNDTPKILSRGKRSADRVSLTTTPTAEPGVTSDASSSTGKENTPRTDVKINDKPSIWCIGTNRKC
ncbi:Plasmodium variant antigen protein Cir/Yir/Bir, putative, partial [Plasmodium chabaudi adami]